MSTLKTQSKAGCIENKIHNASESLGCSLNTHLSSTNLHTFEFSKFSPAGQDFSFETTMEDEKAESFIKSLRDYYEGFDVDYETYLWIGSDGHGKNGAPYCIKDILIDMESVEDMIQKLFQALEEALL